MKRIILNNTDFYKKGILNTLCISGYNLTISELILCSFIFENYSREAIIDNLNISIRTLDNHRNNIKKKFQLENVDKIEVFLKKIK